MAASNIPEATRTSADDRTCETVEQQLNAICRELESVPQNSNSFFESVARQIANPSITQESLRVAASAAGLACPDKYFRGDSNKEKKSFALWKMEVKKLTKSYYWSVTHQYDFIAMLSDAISRKIVIIRHMRLPLSFPNDGCPIDSRTIVVAESLASYEYQSTKLKTPVLADRPRRVRENQTTHTTTVYRDCNTCKPCTTETAEKLVYVTATPLQGRTVVDDLNLGDRTAAEDLINQERFKRQCQELWNPTEERRVRQLQDCTTLSLAARSLSQPPSLSYEHAAQQQARARTPCRQPELSALASAQYTNDCFGQQTQCVMERLRVQAERERQARGGSQLQNQRETNCANNCQRKSQFTNDN